MLTHRPRLHRLVVISTAAALVSGCSGGGNVPRSVAAPSGSVAASPGRTTTSLAITIPHPATTTAASVRKPAYVSPATTSLTLAITGTNGTANPTGYPTTVGLTPTSTGCASSLASTVCTIALNLAPGSYAASVSTDDKNGALLSQAQNVAFTIVAGMANAIPLTLGGIPASIAVAPLTPGYLQGSVTGLDLFGASTQTLIVNALDVDKNIIVGAGAPAITAGSSTTAVGVTAPTATSPNAIALTAAASGTPAVVTPGNLTLTITITPATNSGGTAVVAKVPLRLDHTALYVTTGKGGIDVFYDGNTGAPNSVFNAGSANPYGAAVDGLNDLFVANYGSKTIAEYSAGTVTPSRTFPSVDEPNGLAIDLAGNLYVADPVNGNVLEYGSGSSTVTATYGGLNLPTGVAVDAAGTLYVADFLNGNVVEYAAGTTVPGTTITAGIKSPQGVAIEPSGTLAVANNQGNTVTEYLPGSTAPLGTAYTGISTPVGIAADAGGSIFVANSGSSTIGIYHSGTAAPVATISLTNQPDFVAAYPLAVSR